MLGFDVDIERKRKLEVFSEENKNNDEVELPDDGFAPVPLTFSDGCTTNLTTNEHLVPPFAVESPDYIATKPTENEGSGPVQKKQQTKNIFSGQNKDMRPLPRNVIELKCKNCKDKGVIVTDYVTGDRLCTICGLVASQKILSEEQEWRSFTNDSSSGKGSERNRVGGQIDPWLDSTGTTIVGGNKKLQYVHDLACSSNMNDKLLRNALYNLRLISEVYCFSEVVIERSKEIVKDLQRADALKGRTGMVYSLAVTYLACREAGVPRLIKELATYDKTISEKDIGKAVLKVKRLLPDRVTSCSSETAADVMPRFGSRLQLSIHLIDTAEYVARMFSKFVNKSHRPCSVAGAAICFVTQLSNVPIDISQVASIAGASENTVRTVLKEMFPISTHILPAEFKPLSGTGGNSDFSLKARSRTSNILPIKR